MENKLDGKQVFCFTLNIHFDLYDVFINCFSQIFTMFSFLSLSVQPIRTPQFAVWKKYSGLGGRCATLPEAGTIYILITYERHERKPGKKISFYWQQVGFDSVSSQQRPRLDAFYTENIFFKKTVLFLKNPEEKETNYHGKFKFIKKF